MFVKPLGVLVALIGIGRTNFRRINWLGLSWGWHVAVMLWLFASMGFLVGIGNFWGANFGMGLLYVQFSFLTLFLLVFMGFLAFARRETSGDAHPRLWLIAAIAAGYITYILRGTVFSGITTIPLVGSLFAWVRVSVESVLRPFDQYILLGLPVQGVLIAGLLVFSVALLLIWLVENFNAAPGKRHTR